MKAPKTSLAERLVAATRKIRQEEGILAPCCCVLPKAWSSAAAQDSQMQSAVKSGQISLAFLEDLPSTSTSLSGPKTCHVTLSF